MMSKKMKKILIIVVCTMAALLLLHLSVNYFIPSIKEMHSGMI